MIFLHKLYKTYQIIDKKYKHARLKKLFYIYKFNSNFLYDLVRRHVVLTLMNSVYTSIITCLGYSRTYHMV